MEFRHTSEAPTRRAFVRAMPAAPRLSRRAGLWAVAFSFLVVAAFSTAPSSLYGLFAHRYDLSSLTITFAYAVYAVGVVVSLVLVGHLALFEIAGIVSGAGSGAIFRGSLTTVILTSGPDDRAGVLAGVRQSSSARSNRPAW